MLESDVANYVVQETQKRAKEDLNNLFGGLWKKSNGISNFQIEEALTNIGDEDIENNFTGVFPLNHMNKFIDHKLIISGKKKERKYPFIIANTDASSKSRMHWWSILNIEPKTDIFFLDSFRLDGLKNFIIQDDRKVIEKILFGTNQITRTDKKNSSCKY